MSKKKKKDQNLNTKNEQQEEELKEWASENKGGFNTPFSSLKDLLKNPK